MNLKLIGPTKSKDLSPTSNCKVYIKYFEFMGFSQGFQNFRLGHFMSHFSFTHHFLNIHVTIILSIQYGCAQPGPRRCNEKGSGSYPIFIKLPLEFY